MKKLSIMLAIVLVLALVSCGGDDGNVTGGGTPQTATYSGTAGGTEYTLKITENTARYTAKSWDTYELTAGGNTSTGTVTVNGGEGAITLTPGNGTGAVTVSVSEDGINSITGSGFTWDGGGAFTAPGTLTPGNIHTHQWGEWVVTTPPTVTTTGEETRTCALDPSHKETRSVPATGGGDAVSISGTYTSEFPDGFWTGTVTFSGGTSGTITMVWIHRYQTPITETASGSYTVSGTTITCNITSPGSHKISAGTWIFTIINANNIYEPRYRDTYTKR